MPRPGHSFQSLWIDLLATGDAFPKTAFADAGQRVFDHHQQLPVVVALMKQKFFVIRTGSLVRDVLRRIFIGATRVDLDASTGHMASDLIRTQLGAAQDRK